MRPARSARPLHPHPTPLPLRAPGQATCTRCPLHPPLRLPLGDVRTLSDVDLLRLAERHTRQLATTECEVWGRAFAAEDGGALRSVRALLPNPDPDPIPIPIPMPSPSPSPNPSPSPSPSPKQVRVLLLHVLRQQPYKPLRYRVKREGGP